MDALARLSRASKPLEKQSKALDKTSEVVNELVSDASTGLSTAEAERRLKEFGPNQLTPPQKASFLKRLWNQLNNILIYILFCAAVVEAALQSWAEFGLVFAVIIINAAIGLIQEGKAEKAAEAIKAMLGDKVPADLRLIQTANLQIQEAMLTGESVPVSKELKAAPVACGLGDRKCMAFSATAVTSGQASGIVVATGDSAEVGQISKMVNTVANVKNNLLHQLEILGRWLAVAVGVIALVSFLLSLLERGNDFKAAFESAVSIAVAIIPEGLPAMVTIVLAIGTTVMAKNNAIIRQLPAVETLGSINVICSDKTGTLTKNEMTVVMVRTAASLHKLTGVGYAPEGILTTEGGAPVSDSARAAAKQLLSGGVLCNDSALTQTTDEASGKIVYLPMGAPTEVALLTAGEKLGLLQKQLKADNPRLTSVPFESEHKFMATVHQEGGQRVLYVKGAPDRLLPMCCGQLSQEDSLQAAPAPLDVKFWQKAQAEMSKQGLRVLALCRAELADTFDLEVLNPEYLQSCKPFLTMLLMVAILDPPRDEAVEAIKIAQQAGITVKMITGDHSLTALAIGGMLGIAGNGIVFSGPEVDRINDEALQSIVKDCNVFARASPENKLRIVRALQELKQTVAMTGDGVNDAPALKAADVGVAMGITGTDVSKEAAKMVLADDNFASIVAAVKEGRRVWDNIRKILIFNLPLNLAQGTSVLYSYILVMPASPLTALQGRSLGQRRAEAFNVLVGAQVAYFINCRFLKLSTLHPRVFKGNKVAPFSIVATLGLMVFLTFTPKVNNFFHMERMAGYQWARVAVCMVIVYLVVELEKALVDPLLMPMIRPVFKAIERVTPAWLSVDVPLSLRLIKDVCKQEPRTLSRQFSVQRRGKKRASSDTAPKQDPLQNEVVDMAAAVPQGEVVLTVIPEGTGTKQH
eukprot:gene11376-11525_t